MPAQPSMVIMGTVAEWEQWTDMAFPESGQYVVPDALDLVDINREKDRGTYKEESARCTFCDKYRDQVTGLAAMRAESGDEISGPAAICVECLSLCEEILADELG